jgi:hypothetical protein
MAVNVVQEDYPSKVAAIFQNESEARDARHALLKAGHFTSKLINIIKPNDPKLSQKVEPESHGYAKTMVRSHGVLGLIGLFAGIILASILTATGPTFTQASPIMTIAVLSLLGLFIGMMAAGALTLRPNHDPLITETIEASRKNQWTVIVHTNNREATELASEILEDKAIYISKAS